jgi:hypothetical protein
MTNINVSIANTKFQGPHCLHSRETGMRIEFPETRSDDEIARPQSFTVVM